MKKHTLICLFAIGSIALLGGCSSSRYALVTSDYAIHVATSKPEIEADTDSMSFQDETGKKVSLPRTDVKGIRDLN